MKIEDKFIVTTSDGVNLALWRIFDPEMDKINDVFLTHGAFSDKHICLGIANHLASLGYVCWIMEWRNHGESAKSSLPYNFETIAKFDIASVFNYLFETQDISNLHCITHSGGGISLTMFLINNQNYISKLNSITLFSCQVFGASHSSMSHSKLIFAKCLSWLMRCVPGKLLGLGPHNESYFTMKQWFDWNINHDFTGEGEFNYLDNMRIITTPILSISSKGDAFIAPKQGCLDFINAFDNSKNDFTYYSNEQGHHEDYNHSRIFFSKNAAKEVWPKVVKWMKSTQ